MYVYQHTLVREPMACDLEKMKMEEDAVLHWKLPILNLHPW